MAGDRFARLGAPPQPMQAALRGYLVRHLTATRCEDSLNATDPVWFFNGKLTGQTAIAPISEDESKPAKREGKAEISRAPDLAGFDELASQTNALIWKDPPAAGIRRVGSLDFKDPDAADMEEVLAKLRDWKGSAEQDAVEVFHRKAAFYFSLLQWSLPRMGKVNSFRPEILSELIVTLEDTAILDAWPSDWLSEANKPEPVRAYTNSQNEIVPLLDKAQAMLHSSVSALQVYGKLALLDH